MKKICSRCIMDSSVDDILFDENNMCNYCTDFIQHLDVMGARETSIKSLDELSKIIKKDGSNKPYDCIVGVSGGVDSSWVLYKTKKMGLRPLAVHMDNGWNSELAQNNIEVLVRNLDVHLHTHVINWSEYRGLMQAFFDADVIDVELLYDNAMLGLNYRIARKYGVKWILAGTNKSTEGMRMPTNWNWLKYDKKNITAIGKRNKMSIKTFPAISVLEYIWYQYITKYRWISFLDFEDYNKDHALKILENECGYKRYPYKHYESIFTRFYQGFILPKKFNVDKRLLHLSTLVISKQMSRNQALKLMEQPPYEDEFQLELDLEYFLKKMKWTKNELYEYLDRPPVSHDNYPSEIKKWIFFRKIYRRIKT